MDRSSQVDDSCLEATGEFEMTMPGLRKGLTHGAKRRYESTMRLEREEEGETRKQNVRTPSLFILLDNADRPARGPIVRAARDRILVPKRKFSIVHSLVGQWLELYGKLL